MIIKLQIINDKNIIPEEAELTIVDESVFSGRNDIITYMKKYKSPKLGICIIQLSSNRGGDAGELTEDFEGIAYDINSCISLYDYIKNEGNVPEEIVNDDWGVSKEEFEEHLYQLSLSDDDPNKRD